LIAHEVNSQKTALLVFDMHNQIVKPLVYDKDSPGAKALPHIEKGLIPRLKKLIEHCRSKGIPVIYTYHAHRKDGSDMGIVAELVPGVKERTRFIMGMKGIEIYDEIKPQEGDIVVDKRRFSAFYETDLELILRGMGVDTLIIAGAVLDLGLESTARDAVDRDFKLILPSDGVAARDLPDAGWGPIPHEEVEKVVLTSLAHRFARVLTTEELLAELR
jgi:nicotinamidase-related amidase